MTDPGDNRIGSLWRRWDLHIHTPGTKLNDCFAGKEKDEVWNRYIDALEDSPVQVFGITDYFSCERYFELVRRFHERKPDSSKIFFPNIEFRLTETVNKAAEHIHAHVIFDNDERQCPRQKIDEFLAGLETHLTNVHGVRLKCSELSGEDKFVAATVSLTDITGRLQSTFGTNKPYLLFAAANGDGLRADSNSPRKRTLSDALERKIQAFFGSDKNREWFLRTDRYDDREIASEPKPVVTGSDAHSFADLDRLGGDVAGFPPTWIKADTTFAGLREICHEPEGRVHIGAAPDVLTRQDQDGTKFLRSLQIDQIKDYTGQNGKWFKEVDLPLNPELTAIIGNKGSGKSALVDIIGLLGNSRQEAYFSFLTDESKSKKFRQRGFAENFTASLTWYTGRIDKKLLSDHCDIDQPESVRYLPQNYFEQLTNEIEIEQFRHEIEDVVFSHVDETERLGTTSFSELEEKRTQQSREEISALKKQLRELNIEIVRLEEQQSPQYRKQLQAQIEAKRQELQALDGAKPPEVPKPDTETPEQLALADEVAQLTSCQNEIKERGNKTVAEITKLKGSLQHAVSVHESIKRLESGLRSSVSDLKEQLAGLGLKIDEIVSYSINFKPLEEKIEEIQSKISALELDNKREFDGVVNVSSLETLPDLKAAYAYVKAQIEQRKEQLSTPQRRYQAYIERLSAWTTKRLEIAGEGENAKPGTLASLNAELVHLTRTVTGRLEEKLNARRDLVKQIFESKNSVLQFYSGLTNSVKERLQTVRSDGFPIQIDASFVIGRDFRREFLNQINQRKRGPYRNDQDAQQEIGRRIGETNWNDVDAVIGFCEGLLDCMKLHNGDELSVADQAHDVKELYDFLFSMEYLTSRYELRLGDKNLNELSPGEKGLLLLIFYLQLDRKNTPLVIDQPEDNLDNDSIFQVLAKCIRSAKMRRQVILVTHNPNLAVGADAEQIVYVKLEKSKDYEFSMESGSIENPNLNNRIVQVLEGSQPAFVKRRLKYGIK